VDGLVLRPPGPEEAADALALLRDPEVDRWNPAPAVVDLASAADWCARGADWSSGAHATFSIIDEATDDFVGNISLHNIDPELHNADVGYRIAAHHRGRGAATAALRAVTTWAFDDLRLFRIQLFHAVANAASCRTAEKAGYVLEGTLRGSGLVDGVRHDEHVHGRLRTDP
jgi:RimJ/RimL family protein N-acetyltransferase